MELAAWKLRESESSDHARLGGMRVNFGNVNVDAQRGIGSEMEQFLAGGVGVGIHQSADIHITSGDDAVKGSVHLFIRYELLEPGNVCLRGSNFGGSGGGCLDGVVHILLRNRVGGEQMVIAIGGDLRELQIGLVGGKLSA